MPDTLAAALARLHAAATERGIPVVPGYLREKKATGAHLLTFADGTAPVDADPVTLMQSFLAATAALDIAMFVTWVNRLEEDDWRAAVKTYEQAIADLEASGESSAPGAESAHASLREALKEARAARTHVGEVAYLDVSAVTRNPAAIIDWSEATDWSAAVSDPEGTVADARKEAAAALKAAVADADGAAREEASRARQEEWAARERERRLWTAKRRTEASRRLAELPEFGKCAREADRVYMLRKLLGDEAPSDEHMLKEIAREALAIYRLEIGAKA